MRPSTGGTARARPGDAGARAHSLIAASPPARIAGPHTPDTPGGTAFEIPGSANAMPCVGSTLSWRRATLATLAEAGHCLDNGYAKLVPIT